MSTIQHYEEKNRRRTSTITSERRVSTTWFNESYHQVNGHFLYAMSKSKLTRSKLNSSKTSKKETQEEIQESDEYNVEDQAGMLLQVLQLTKWSNCWFV